MPYTKEQIKKEEWITNYIDDLVRNEKSRIIYAIDNFKTQNEQAEFLNMSIRTYLRRLSEYNLLKFK